MTEALYLRRDGPVATLQLNRPTRRNAMSRAMWLALPELVAEAAADDAVAVLRIEGAGGHFCGGADIGEFAEAYATAEASAATNAAIRLAVEAVAACLKPVVAMIRGACVGGGVAIALACDLRLAGDDARFAVTPVKLGLIYSHADTLRLVRAIGVGPTREMLFSARAVDAHEALRLGLIERLWPAVDFEAASAAYIAALAAASRPALRQAKAMLAAIDAGQASETVQTRALFDELFAGADFAEGYRAFLEKRPPHFTAR